MDNFDLRKYLAEGKLHEQKSPKFKIDDFVQPIEGATSYLLDKPRGTISSKYVGQIGDVYINKPENLEMIDGEYLYSVDKLNYRGKMAMSFGFKESDLELISDPTEYIKSLTPYRRLNEIDEDDEYEIASRKLFDMTWGEVRRQNNQDMVQDVHDEVSKDDEEDWDDDDNMYTLRESEEQYPNFDLNKNIKYQDTSISSGMWRYTGQEQGGKGVYRNLNNGQILGFDRNDFDIFRKNLSSHFDFSESLNEDRKYNQEELLRLDLIARRRFDCDYKNCTDEQKTKVLKDKVKVGVKEALQESKKDLDEAEFKGKKVALGKPKRGGPKAYYVYVKDGDKVKKVTFGSGGLRAKIKNKEARNAFAARHKCSTKKDRTKAGYWSCNLPRYAPALGLGAKMNTFW